MNGIRVRENRGRNFDQGEVEKLLKLINKHKAVIEHKKSNTQTWQEKSLAWLRISESFNKGAIVKRTPYQLKKKYDNYKKEMRKHAQENEGGEEGRVSHVVKVEEDDIECLFTAATPETHFPSASIDGTQGNGAGFSQAQSAQPSPQTQYIEPESAAPVAWMLLPGPSFAPPVQQPIAPAEVVEEDENENIREIKRNFQRVEHEMRIKVLKAEEAIHEMNHKYLKKETEMKIQFLKEERELKMQILEAELKLKNAMLEEYLRES